VTDGGWTSGEQQARDPRSRPDRPWWEGAVFYQIYPRSFQDTPISEWSPDRRAAVESAYPGWTLADANVQWGYGTQGDQDRND
jgi:hypothetical protein